MEISFKIAKESKEEIVKYFYEQEDVHYFLHVHEREGTKEECIADSLQTISERTVFFNVYDGVRLVATFGRYEDPFGELGLEMFHVVRPYRNSLFLGLFSEIIKAQFEKTFYVGAYQQNEGSIRFLQKAGFEKINEMEQKGKKVFIYKFEK